MSLLSTIQRAAALTGSGVSVTSSTVGDGVLLAELARVEAEELASRFDWQALVKDHTFMTAGAELQVGGLPADYGRMTQRGGTWNQTGHLQLAPLPPEMWAETRASAVNGVFNRYRIAGGAFYIVPAPSVGQTVSYPYISRNLYRNAGSNATKYTWDTDTDECLLSERLVALGVVWRWLKIKGLSYAEDMATYERQLEREASADGVGPERVQLGRARFSDVSMAYPGVIVP